MQALSERLQLDDGTEIELAIRFSEDATDDGGLTLTVGNDQLIQLTTSRVNEGEHIVRTTLSPRLGGGDEAVIELKSRTTGGDKIVIDGTVGGARLSGWQSSELQRDADVAALSEALEGDPQSVDLGPLEDIPLAELAQRLRARFEPEIVDSGRGKGCAACRAECTAKYAECCVPCRFIPLPQARLACLAVCSSIYARCYWLGCRSKCN